MKICFVYVNYFSSQDVISSISSLLDMTSKTDLETCVYIVDNSFADACMQDARDLNAFAEAVSCSRFSVSYLPSDKNHGFGKACNKAAFLSQSDLIIFVNCDTSFDDTNPKYFRAMLSLFGDQDVAIVGPRVTSKSGFLHASCFSFDPISIALKPLRHVRKVGSSMTQRIPSYKFFKKRIDRITYEGMDLNSPAIVDWVSGCFMVVRPSFFASVGGFDGRFFMYFEDVDLCRKARQVNQIVLFDPRVVILHAGRHASARRQGILRSLFFNNTARHHLFSWISYCIKWRQDFVEKLLSLYKYKLGTTLRPKSAMGYGMDFSSCQSYVKSSCSVSARCSADKGV